MDDDLSAVVVNAVDDPIVADSHPVKILCAFEFDRLPRKRLLLEAFDPPENACYNLLWQSPKVPLDRRLEDDAIGGHLSLGGA
jgi:hypothetical protein